MKVGLFSIIFCKKTFEAFSKQTCKVKVILKDEAFVKVHFEALEHNAEQKCFVCANNLSISVYK